MVRNCEPLVFAVPEGEPFWGETRQRRRGGWSGSGKGESLPSEPSSPRTLKPPRMQAEDKERRSSRLGKPRCWVDERWGAGTSTSDVTLKQELIGLKATL